MGELKKISMHAGDLVIAKLADADSAIICKPCECLSGVTINFISLREFNKFKEENNLDDTYNISFFEVDKNTSLVISSSFATESLDTEIFEAYYAGKRNISWKVVEREIVAEK